MAFSEEAPEAENAAINWEAQLINQAFAAAQHNREVLRLKSQLREAIAKVQQLERQLAKYKAKGKPMLRKVS